MVALGSLVAGFAHELNTPLGNTLIAATTLQEKNQQFQRYLREPSMSRSQLNKYLGETGQILDLMERNARRASELIVNLKQIAVDTASDKPRLFSLERLVTDTIELMMPALRRQTIEIRFDIASDIELLSFPGALEQVITNLMNNALIHAFEGRSVGVVMIRANLMGNGKVELIFEDDGVGIAPDIQSHVFEPFFTTRFGQGGSGLGLYLVYTLVVGSLRGEIKVGDSELGGAKFALTLLTDLSE
jgi:two-component system NtrC family sensor kinase